MLIFCSLFSRFSISLQLSLQYFLQSVSSVCKIKPFRIFLLFSHSIPKHVKNFYSPFPCFWYEFPFLLGSCWTLEGLQLFRKEGGCRWLLVAAVWQINCSGEACAGKAPLCKSNKAGTRALGYNEKDEPK